MHSRNVRASVIVFGMFGQLHCICHTYGVLNAWALLDTHKFQLTNQIARKAAMNLLA